MTAPRFRLKTQLRKPSTVGLWQKAGPRRWVCGNVSIVERTGHPESYRQSWVIMIDGDVIETDSGRWRYGSASQAKIGASLMANWAKRRKA